MEGTTHRCPVLSGAEQVCKALAHRAPPRTGSGDTMGSHGMRTVDAERSLGAGGWGSRCQPPALPHRCCTAWQCHRTPHVTAAGLMWLSSRLALLPGSFAQSKLGWVLTSCMEQGSPVPSWHSSSWESAAPVLLLQASAQVWGAERRQLGAAAPWDALGLAWSRQAAELDALNHAYVCMHVL